VKHQIKSSNYYLFWGIATIAVVTGQIYVGSGYRSMAMSVDYLTEVIRDGQQNQVGMSFTWPSDK